MDLHVYTHTYPVHTYTTYKREYGALYKATCLRSGPVTTRSYSKTATISKTVETPPEKKDLELMGNLVAYASSSDDEDDVQAGSSSEAAMWTKVGVDRF